MNVFRSLGMLAACAVLLGVATPPAKRFAFADAVLGVSVAKLIAAHGAPEVVTTDVGQVWTWDGPDKVRVTTDDNGIVRILDLVPDPKDDATFTVPATKPPLYLAFGTLTLAAADRGLASLFDSRGRATLPDSGAKADFRAYALSPALELVLLFDDKSHALNEAFYGERLFLARGGVLPSSIAQPGPRFTAPTIVHQGAADYPHTRHQGDAYVRIAVDKTGAVSDATIFLSSGDADLDKAAIASAKADTFVPAKLGETPVSSIVFHKEQFRTSAR